MNTKANGKRRTKPLQVAAQMLGARFRWRHPLYLIHSLTGRCNAKCGFCAWNFYDGKDELSTPEIKQLYRDAKDAGFFGLSVWGGEPLVHPDVGEVCEYAQQLGLTTHMVTNGAVLERKADQIMPHLDRICISVDHPSEKHDEFRGVPGLYGKIMDATRVVRRRYPHAKVLYVYTFLNGNTETSAIREMAKVARELGVVTVFNAMRLEAASADPAHQSIADFNPSQEQLSEAFRVVRELKTDGYPILNSYTHLDMMRQGPPKYKCHWPKFNLPVEANGDVVDCMHWGVESLGNIRKTPFKEILKSRRLRDLAGPVGEACHKCVSLHRVEISEVCEGTFEPLLSWVEGLAPRQSLLGKVSHRISQAAASPPA